MSLINFISVKEANAPFYRVTATYSGHKKSVQLKYLLGLRLYRVLSFITFVTQEKHKRFVSYF